MNKDIEKITFKTYTKEKKQQDKRTTNQLSGYSKKITFDKYKINSFKFNQIRNKSNKKDKINSTVNYQKQTPLKTAFKIHQRHKSEMNNEFPSIKRKSHTPSPLTKISRDYRYMHTSPGKEKDIGSFNKNGSPLMRPLRDINKANGHSRGSSANYTQINDLRFQRKPYTPICTSPKNAKDSKPNSLSKPMSPSRVTISNKDTEVQLHTRIQDALNFKKKVYQMTQVIEKMKVEHKQQIKAKDEEIASLLQQVNYINNTSDNAMIVKQQENTIKEIGAKLKQTQHELEEYKELCMKQKKSIDSLTAQVRVLEIDRSNKQNSQSPHLSHKSEGEAMLSNCLLTQEQVDDVSLVLRKIFEVNKLSLETVVYSLFENDVSLSFEKVTDKLLTLINNKHKSNQILLLNYFKSLAHESNEVDSHLELMKTQFIDNMAKLRLIYTKELETKLNKDLVSALLSNKEALNKQFQDNDIKSTGLISLEALKEILSQLQLKLSNDNYEQMIYIMKQFNDCNCDLYELNYNNIVRLIKGIKEENANKYITHTKSNYNEEVYDVSQVANRIVDDLFQSSIKDYITTEELQHAIGNDINRTAEKIVDDLFQFSIKKCTQTKLNRDGI